MVLPPAYARRPYMPGLGSALVQAGSSSSLLTGPPKPRTTTLVNDTQHPFSPRALARMQRWVDRSLLPTAQGRVTVSRGVPNVIAEGLAGDHLIALNYADRFALMHELGHESQMFTGTGSSIVDRSGNYGHPGQGWSQDKITALAKALHMPVAKWDKGDRSLSEVAADAYAVEAMNPKWRRWWGHPDPHAKPGQVSWVDTSTPYNFTANRRQFRQIRDILSR